MDPKAGKISRRKFLKRLGAGASCAGVAGTVGWVEAHRVEVTHTSIPIEGLPAPLEGFTILQMSDFHHSMFVSAEYLAECVAMANREMPNLIALTGDFITGPRQQKEHGYESVGMSVPRIDEYLKKCIEVLAPLAATHGIFTVLGNHDGWYNFDKVVAEIGKTEWRLLRDENQTIEVGDARLQVIGLRDLLCERINVPEAFRGIDPAHPTLVLMHNPDSFAEVATHQADLILAGHTHGGQVSLPFIGPPIVPSRYAAGLFHLGKTRMYVNRGVGVIPPPVRFRVRPEISVFTLTSKASA